MSGTVVALPRFPSERTGTGQRSRLLVEGAARVGAVHVVLLDGSSRVPPPSALPGATTIDVLRSERLTPSGRVGRLLGGGLRVLAPARSYEPDPALRGAMLELARRYGAGAVVFRYARLHAAAGLGAGDGPRVLVDVDDRDDQKYATRLERRLGSRLAASAPARLLLARLAGLLRVRLSQADHVWFVTAEDVWDLAPATTSLLPNVPYWDGPADAPTASEAPPVALFVGIRDHLPNAEGMRWFVSHVWPRLRALAPEARLRVVGRGNWAAMGAEFPEVEGIEWVGEVDDLAAEYTGARLAICPVREGGGSKIKLIEAAAFARPVVAHPHAARGFHGEGLDRVAQSDDPEGFAEACAAFLKDPAHAAETGEALRRWQERHYSRGAFASEVARVLRG